MIPILDVQKNEICEKVSLLPMVKKCRTDTTWYANLSGMPIYCQNRDVGMMTCKKRLLPIKIKLLIWKRGWKIIDPIFGIIVTLHQTGV